MQHRQIPAGVAYSLEYKKVKNINLRIGKDGKVYVSAPRWVSASAVDAFVESRARWIADTLARRVQKSTLTAHYTEEEICGVILDICKRVYPLFAARGIPKPQIKFRKMVSQWGNCRAAQGILTLNTNLRFVPPECIEYVVLHEFTHFLEQNHSKAFYAELEKVCPEYKQLRAHLKKIRL